MPHFNENEEDQKSPPRDKNGWDGKLRLEPKQDVEEQGTNSPPDTDEEELGEASKEVQPEDQSNSDAPAKRAKIEVITEHPGDILPADEDLLADVDSTETDLDVTHARLKSVDALDLQRFTQLRRLCFRQNELKRIHFPEAWDSAKTLKELDLYDNEIEHFEFLEQFAELTSLDLSFNRIKHIRGLGHMRKLKEVFFVQNKIVEIKGLEQLTELTSLELGANRIREIENLDTLVNLRELWLGKNKITEIKNLTSLTNLTLLSIQSNRLTSASLAHLSALPKLTDLYISHNAIDSLEPLSSSHSLHIIDVSSNPITSLRGLETHKEIEEIWASNCKLGSFEEVEEVLADKTALTTVYFEGNPLQLRQPVLYRNKVKLALPNIKQIDATFTRAQ